MRLSLYNAEQLISKISYVKTYMILFSRRTLHINENSKIPQLWFNILDIMPDAVHNLLGLKIPLTFLYRWFLPHSIRLKLIEKYSLIITLMRNTCKLSIRLCSNEDATPIERIGRHKRCVNSKKLLNITYKWISSYVRSSNHQELLTEPALSLCISCRKHDI